MLTKHGFDRITLEFALEKYVQKGMEGRAIDVMAEMVTSGLAREFVVMMARTMYKVLGHTTPILSEKIYALNKKIDDGAENLNSIIGRVLLEMCRAKHTRIATWMDYISVRTEIYSGISSSSIPQSYERFFGARRESQILKVFFASFCYAIEHRQLDNAIRCASVIECISNRKDKKRPDIGDLYYYRCKISPNNPIVKETEIAETPLALVYHRLGTLINKSRRSFIRRAAQINTRESLFSAILALLRDKEEIQKTEEVSEEEVEAAIAARPFAEEQLFDSTDSYDIMKGRQAIPPIEDFVYDFRHPICKDESASSLEPFAKKNNLNDHSAEFARSHKKKLNIPLEERTFRHLLEHHYKVENPTEFEPAIHRKVAADAMNTYAFSKLAFNEPRTLENERFNDFIMSASMMLDRQSKQQNKRRKV